METRFYQDDDDNRVALLLSAGTPAMTARLAAFFSKYGASAVTTVHGSRGKNSSVPGFLAPFDEVYLGNEDFENVLVGLGAAYLSILKTPSFGVDDYEKILTQLFALPPKMANNMAREIDTDDILKSSKGDEGLWTSITNKLTEGARNILNWGASVLQLPWEMDQTQKYDIDCLFEMSMLGEKIAKLNRRVRLMKSQALLAANTGLMMTGDPGTSDQDEIDQYVGDVFSRAASRNLPPAMLGGLAPLAQFGRAATAAEGAQIMRQAGVTTTPAAGNGEAQVSMGKPLNVGYKNAVTKIMNMNPSKALLLGAGLGVTPMAIKGILRLAKGAMNRGDIEENQGIGDAYSTVATDYGDTAADAWLMGDIAGVMNAIADEATGDATCGDPEMDDLIANTIVDEMSGDIEESDPEVGGILMRARINRARKTAANRSMRNERRQLRHSRKVAQMRDLQAAKLSRKRNYANYDDAGPAQYQEPEMDNGTGFDSGADMGGGDDTAIPFPEF